MKTNMMRMTIVGIAATGLLLSAAASYADDTLRIVSWGELTKRVSL